MMIRLMLLLALLCSVSTAHATFRFIRNAPAPSRAVMYPYYGEEFYKVINQGESNNDLRALIRTVMRSDHRLVAGKFDEIMPRCQGQGCYRHTVIGYNKARVFLMGYFYLVQEGNRYGVRDVYCEAVYGGGGAGPNKIPNANVINVEHTWPQSRFSGRFPAEEQKSDLHHLFPTDSQMNSTRSSFPFGEIVRDRGPLKCPGLRFGTSASGQMAFEPPDDHKGNVARALFYFATRYDLQIAAEEEATLRVWNRQDPVDQEEARRNEEIYKAQGSRNPYIDYPILAERIADF